MKITKIDVVCPKTSFAKPVGCRIYTDEGIYGDGETSLNTGVGAEAGAAMIKRMAKFLIGADPLHSEAIWDSFLRLQATFWGQNGGPIVYGAMSALDIALWDIKGKYFDTPVYNLLGGKKRNKLRAYLSQPQFGWELWDHAKKPEEYARNAKKALDMGYDAIKIDYVWGTPEYKLKGLQPGSYWNMIEKNIQITREAIGDADLIIENHGTTDAMTALQLAKIAEPYNIFYLEEPTIPDADLTKYISDRTTIPIASGERIQTRWQYRPYFEKHALSVIQPDVGTCGGITEAKRIADMAYVYDIGVQMHNCHYGISQAANLHLETSMSNFVIHEDLTRFVATLENGSPICTHNFPAENGYVQAPEEPGLGVEWTEETMKTSVIASVTEQEPDTGGLIHLLDASYYGE